ncbi:MAG: hypothetical protein V1847_01600 [Candidatus Diapherotrites archaeon]
MQTTLYKQPTLEMQSFVQKNISMLSYFIEKYSEWSHLKGQKRAEKELEHFTKMHGIAFTQLLELIDQHLEELP